MSFSNVVLSGSKLLCVFSENSAFTGKEIIGIGSVGLDGFGLACSLSVRTMGEDGKSGCRLPAENSSREGKRSAMLEIC